MPYMLILGEQEVETGNISVRDRSNETVQMSVDEFLPSCSRRSRPAPKANFTTTNKGDRPQRAVAFFMSK